MKKKSITLKTFIDDVTTRAQAIGLGPESVVAEAGVSIDTWRSWVKGTNLPNLRTMDLIHRTLERIERSKP